MNKDKKRTLFSDKSLEETLVNTFITELEKSGKNIEDIDNLDLLLSEVITKASKESAVPILNTLKKNSPKMLMERRKELKLFRKRLNTKWKNPLDLLEILLVSSTEAGESFNSEHREEASKKRDFVFDVLVRLHGNACLIGNEIITLLQSGFPDGAHSRWRTTHEISVIGSFIKKHGNEVAERYLLHDTIESYKAMLIYKEYAEFLGYQPLSASEEENTRRTKRSLCERFGRKYSNNYGWASEALTKDNPNFSDIEKSVGLNHLRPFYKLASHHVHSNPKGILFKLGLFPLKHDVLLVGPSNYGLTDPAHGMAISLTQITASLLTLKTNINGILVLQTLLKLEQKIGDEFLKVQREIENFEKEQLN